MDKCAAGRGVHVFGGRGNRAGLGTVGHLNPVADPSQEASLSGNAHPKTQKPSDADLKANPGIGSSRGANSARDEFEAEEGENTFEGDVGNDTNAAGGVDPNHLGRTNK